MDKRLIGNIVYNKLQRQNSVWKCGCLCVYYNMSSLKILMCLKLSTRLKLSTQIKVKQTKLKRIKVKQTKLKQANSKNLFQWNSNSRR